MADQVLFGQHSAAIVPVGRLGAGNMTLFNNKAPGGSQVTELALPLDAAGNFVLGGNGRFGPAALLWTCSAPGLFSPIMSSVERPANGHTPMCSATGGRVFEITAGGQTVGQFQTTRGETYFHAHYVERSLWTDTSSLSATAGGRPVFDVVSGSAHAGHSYLVLGSASGTSPGLPLQAHVLPLVPMAAPPRPSPAPTECCSARRPKRSTRSAEPRRR